ncbi:hypothetical protein SKAU_G00060850 [Synaphobranchus kaupii]|uniref:Ig-like domain-containing protein n=1 Tax=Synaphobranchus kaupii TaxID=118154 RepID=A0A9Q1G4Z9_SYNKA|nr:hypothetical protein SKAU_G00060850 [Synaphobranchus kaupii]
MVRWFKGETLLESCKKYRIKQEMKTAELTIQDLEGNDSGEYRCQAGGCKSKATLTVEVRRVKIVKHLRDAEVEEDSSAMFSCELNYSNVNAQWFLNKKSVCPNNVTEINHVGNTHSLTLKRLPPEDSLVTIQAENASESASLKIKENAAMFVKPLENVVGEEADTISLECEASKPLVTPIWKKDGVVLPTSEKYELLHFFRFIGLIIHDLRREDTGEYCCDLATDQTKSRVTVKGMANSESQNTISAMPAKIYLLG